MHSLNSLIWRNLTAHPLRSILTALAIALGVGMVLAASIVGQAASQSASALSEEGPRVDLEVFSRDGTPFDEAVLDTLRASPDIEQVSPALRVEAVSVDPPISSLTLLGVAPQIYPELYRPELAGGDFLDTPDSIVLPMAIALDNGLTIGDEMALTGDRATVTLTVAGRLKLEQGRKALAGKAAAYVPLDVAQALAGAPGQIDHIEVVLRPGADADRIKADLIKRVKGDLAVVRAETAGGLAFNTVLIQGGLGMVGLIILFAAGFVILNAFAMSVTGRTREIGALRALGMTRRQVMRTVLGEASLLGLSGAGAGVLIGLGLAWGVMSAMGLLTDALLLVPWWGVVFSPLLGLSATLIGALQPAWRASRVSPVVAVRRENKIGSDWYLRYGGRVGVLILASLLPTLAAYGLIARPGIWTAMAVTGLGMAGILASMVLLLPALIVPLSVFARSILVRWLGTTGRLAADNLGRNKLRSALTAGALAVGLTMIMAFSGLFTLFFEGSIGLIGSMSHEDFYVLPDFARMMASGELSIDNLYQTMATLLIDPAIPDVLAPLVEAGVIELERIGIAPVPPELVTVPTGTPGGMFVDPIFLRIGNFDFYEGDVESAAAWMRRGRAVLLQPLVAERLNVNVGDNVLLDTAKGQVEFTVAGIGGSGTFSPVFPYADGEAYFDLMGLFELGVVVSGGENVGAAFARVKELLAPYPDVVVEEDLDTTIGEAFKMMDRFRSLLNALLLLAVVVASLGVVNTMVINVAERGREIGVLRAVGATQRQVRQAVVAEAAMLGLMAVLIAGGLSLMMLFAYAVVVMPNGWGALGVRSDWGEMWGQVRDALGDTGSAAIVSLIFAPLAAALAAYYPAKQAAATDVVEATRSERVTLRRSRRKSVVAQVRRTLREDHRPMAPYGLSRLEGQRKQPPQRGRGGPWTARALAWVLALRNLQQHRLRTVLSALAVALGVMMVVAADVAGKAVTSFGEAMEENQNTAGILGAQLESWLGAVGLVIIAVAGFLVFNAFAMSVTQRRRQIGALRSLGMTRRQVMRTVLVEALITGGAGTILGLISGPLVGRGLIVLLGEFAGIAYGESLPSLDSMLLASGLGFGITLLSIIFPTRRAVRISPLEALREQVYAPGREPGFLGKTWVLGLLGLGAIVVYLAVAPPARWMIPAEGAQMPWHDVLIGVFSLLWLGCLALILPALVAGLGRWARAPLSRLWGATGRLAADNLRRDRGRVTLTVLTLAVSVMMIVSITGALVLMTELMLSYHTGKQAPPTWALFPVGWSGELASWQTVSELDLSAIGVSDELYVEIVDAFGERAEILEVRAAIVPELDVVPGSMSFFFDAQRMQRMGMFDFYEGDWETALPILQSGCGVLITPGLARRHDAWLYDTLTIPGKDGPVECTIAGLGLSANFGASLIGDGVAGQFDLPEKPFALFLQPLPGVDVDGFGADLDAFAGRYADTALMDLRDADDFMEDVVDGMLAILNGPLLLAIAAAALGVVNTTAMSVAERRRELGLLRAVGATRRQARAVVIGEAMLMGLIGGALGLVAGGGLAAIRVLVGDHSTWGLHDVQLWSLLWRVVRSSALNGLAGTVAAPLICAGAAWLPVRAILRTTPMGTMDERQHTPLVPAGLSLHKRGEPKGGPSFLAWRNVSQYRARTALSGTAVALGVATTAAADIVSGAIRNAVAGSEDAQTLLVGLFDQLDQWLTLMGMAVTLAAGFLVFNAFAMSVTQRRRQIGALRSLGMTRRQVMRTVLLEALITGGTGTLAGLIAGPLLGYGVIALIRTILGDVFVFEPGGTSPANWMLAVMLGLGVTLLSVLIPARRATRVSPLEALRQRTVSGTGARRASFLPGIGGVVVIVSLFAYLAVAPPGEWVEAPWDVLLTLALGVVWLFGLGMVTPALVGGLGKWVQRPMTRLWGAIGRLIADNLRRGRGRVTLTILTLAVGLALIVGMTGLISFFFNELMRVQIEGTVHMGAWMVSKADFISGMGGYVGMEDLTLSPEVVEEIQGALGERARTMAWHFTVVPEVSFWGSSYFSFVLDPHAVRQGGSTFFTFTEGSWETALPAMQEGCGVLVTPAIANRNGVSLGETFEVTGADGPVTCTVAGIGSPYVQASIIGAVARPSFDAVDPIGLLVWPAPGVERAELEVDLASLIDALPDAEMRELADMAGAQMQVIDMLPSLFNALLLLAVVAAALGVVNTTLISVAERRHELGLLRAVGATKRQVMAVVTGEAALMGLIGGALGVVAGTGTVVILAVAYGGNSWGAPDLDLWPSAWRAVQSTLFNSLVGLIAAPFICAGAAWLPVRAILRGTPIETMDERPDPKSLGRPFGSKGLHFLALRNLEQGRMRTALSALAVALGVAMIVAANAIANASRSTIQAADERNLGALVSEVMNVSLIVVGIVILVAAGFLVFNAFAMAITQRRRQIGALRSLGMTRRQVMRLVLFEAILTSGAGTSLGLVTGPLLGRGLIALLEAAGEALGTTVAVFGEPSVSLSSVVVAAALGLGITLLSTLIPARQATRVSPLVALRAQTAPGIKRIPLGRVLFGLLLIVVLVVYLIVAPPGTWAMPPWGSYLSGLFAVAWLLGLGSILPALVTIVSRLVCPPISRIWGAIGRLLVDNLRRNRRRVTLTILTLAVGLTTIVSVTGLMTFMFDILVDEVAGEAFQRDGWIILPVEFDDVVVVASNFNLDTMHIPPEMVAEMRSIAAGRADLVDLHMVNVPELAFFPGIFTYALDPDQLERVKDYVFTFTEGDWASAMPAMVGDTRQNESGCGVLVTPAVASRNDVSLGETFQVTGPKGAVDCTVAGIGRSIFANVSLVSLAAQEAFDLEPDKIPGTLVVPLPDVDKPALEADLATLVDRYPGTSLNDLATGGKVIDIFDTTASVMNAMLLLAIVAAALGVVNTTMISVAERRHELGLLRAVGATRRQVIAVVAGEAALMGLIGGGLGLVAGAGITVIVAVTYGGNAWGVSDLPLWPSAWESVRPALLNGLFGLTVAPFVCAGAAWLPVRSILRGSAVETMQPDRQEQISSRRAIVGLLRRGILPQSSIRTRFVFGTGLLLLIVLAGLIGVVTRHERTYLEDQMHDVLLTMIKGQAGMIELTLSDDAQTLDLSDLEMGRFDADELLRFRALMDDVSEHGLEEYLIADRDNVALLSLDPHEMGTLLPELESSGDARVLSERKDGEWRMRATAPIKNTDGLVVGSVRMTANLAEAQDFMGKTRNALRLIGSGAVVVGLGLSWALATPLVDAVQRLTAHAARVARGEYVSFDRPHRRGLAFLVRTSLRLRLTVAMVLVVALLVGILELVVIPVERHHTESTLREGMVAIAEWMGRVVSEGLDSKPFGNAQDKPFDAAQDKPFELDQMLKMSQTMDWAKLQELSEQMRSEDAAYVALVDIDGVIQFSDQLALIGETVPVPADTRIEDDRWRDEDIWVVSTPLRQGRDGEQIGALRFGVRRGAVEAFLDESRNLFRLSGAIAALASVLLAQVVGGAVTAPVRQLAAGVRQVGRGDFDVRFNVHTGDELATVAHAFDQMVVGLREREWLRDMFGRFVSHEVAEAIHSGQVQLGGENRVVSVLFCDIWDFTLRSEQHTPEEMVALLNEYLPVVVEAAQHHDGTVNKFGGDNSLIIYGAPRKLQESAYQAVLTALEMRANLKLLNARLAEQGGTPIRVGVGINTGTALAGAVGPEERQEYTVIGDTVNLASRIEALNKEYPAYDILIGGQTYEALGTRRVEFEFADLGEVQIRGKVEPVRVWAVVG